MKCRHAMESWESGHRKRCVILGYNSFPTMLDKINKEKNFNVLSCVQKHDIINTKNLHLVTRQGTKIGNDNPRIIKMIILTQLNKKNCQNTQRMYLENLLDKKKLMIIEKAQ